MTEGHKIKLEVWGQYRQSFTSTFYTHRSKKTVKLSVFLGLLGSAHVKAACKMLMKLTAAHAACGPHFRHIWYTIPIQSDKNNGLMIPTFISLSFITALTKNTNYFITQSVSQTYTIGGTTN